MSDEHNDPETGSDTLEAPGPEETISRLEADKAELNDRLLRALAELENTRRRAEREKAEVRIYGIEKFAGDMLGVSDNLSRALGALTEEERTTLPDGARNLFDGIAMTERQLIAALQRHGVTPIEATPGAAFDANVHQAVAQIPSPQAAGTIAECFQPGWKLGDRTLRAAMVAVSAGGMS